MCSFHTLMQKRHSNVTLFTPLIPQLLETMDRTPMNYSYFPKRHLKHLYSPVFFMFIYCRSISIGYNLSSIIVSCLAEE